LHIANARVSFAAFVHTPLFCQHIREVFMSGTDISEPLLGPALSAWQPAALPERRVLEGRYGAIVPLDGVCHARDLFDANQVDRDQRDWAYLPYGPFADFAAYEHWLQQMQQKSDPQFYAVVDTVAQRGVGVAAYLRIDADNGVIEVGHLKFSPLLQRRPLATEAMYLMMKNAFDLGYRRYEWKCNALNMPSRRAAQRLGFSFEGVFRNAAVVKGHSRDTAWYSVIDTEWPALAAAFERWLMPANFTADGQQLMALSQLTAPLLQTTG